MASRFVVARPARDGYTAVEEWSGTCRATEQSSATGFVELMTNRHECAFATSTFRQNGCIRLALGLICVSSLTDVGCTPVARWASGGWVADYDAAEKDVRRSRRGLLIYFSDPRPDLDDTTEKALQENVVKNRVHELVRCRLFKSYEPDRRYVAQFGVRRAPALIVVHADGTYHSHTGSMSSEQIMVFLDSAKPPGALPRINPHIPRQPDYIWHTTLDEAERTGAQTNLPVLIVYHRSLSQDWQRLNALLAKREVYHRFQDMVHCRIGLLNPWTSAYITRFGALALPAIVILRPDGSFNALEMPTSYEAVIQFADMTTSDEQTDEARVTKHLSTTGAASP